MAKNDILPYKANANETGPIADLQHFGLGASESFTVGEPVAVNAAGRLTESADDPGPEDFIGIAAGCGDTVGSTDTIGIFRTAKGMFTPGAVPNRPVTGDLIPVWIAGPGTKLIFKVFATDGAGTAATPALANIGDMAGLSLTAGVWSVDTGTSSTKFIRIVDVVDANGDSVQFSGLTGSKAIGQVVSYELSVTTAPTA